MNVDTNGIRMVAKRMVYREAEAELMEVVEQEDPSAFVRYGLS